MAITFPGRRLFIPQGISLIQLVLTFFYGTWLGFSPSIVNLHCLLLLLSLCFLRLPLILLALTTAMAWVLGWVGVDYVVDTLGLKLLREPALANLWTQLYNAPVLPWTRFNNSMVLGAAALSFILLPVWFGVGLSLRRRAG